MPQIQPIGIGLIANRPTVPAEGRIWIATDAGSERITYFNGSEWVDVYIGGDYAPGSGGAHTHIQADITDLVTDLLSKERTINRGALSGYAALDSTGKVPALQLGGAGAASTNFLRGDQVWEVPSGGGGGGAKSTYMTLLSHFTTLENTVSAAATWKIPAATTYGQVALYYDGTRLGTPAAATLVTVYTNTATSGTNQIGLVFNTSPQAAATTVTPITSSIVTMVNSATYPQVITQALTISDLPTSAQWMQLALKLASASVGPNLMHAALVLYY